jgi:hypothetical protein
MARLQLPTVTLCSAASINVAATLEALRASLDRVEFAECLFFTDLPAEEVTDPRIRVVPITRISSSRAYSRFILEDLAIHIATPHVLVIQWDGFVTDPAAWREEFLHFDYIGAVWPQFGDGDQVGNGGFSLRSRRLLEACRDAAFQAGHPEDVAICRTNRRMLEERHAIHFARPDTAGCFSFERLPPAGPTFGFHGVFNMVDVLGPERFFEIYMDLDERQSIWRDFWPLLHGIGAGAGGWRRQRRLFLERMMAFVKRRKIFAL